MKDTSNTFELHAAGKMRIEEFYEDSHNEKGESIPIEIRQAIETVLNGSHKTFRYMLMTGLLAAVTDSKLHPRCLQVSSGCEGAFDARSFCQEVIVPFEKTFLKGRIGDSGEPFANKPARFEMIEKTNKVRRGKDTQRLYALYDALEYARLRPMPERETMFKYALHVVLQRSPRGTAVASLKPILARDLTSDDFFDFFESHTKGESAVATLAAFFKVFYGKGTKVLVHPSTESGASSKEVGDIDLKFADGRQYAVEVKDKTFKKTDVDHACGKAASAKVNRVIFAVGNAAEKVRVPEMALREKWAAKGVELTFLKISALLGVGMAISDVKLRCVMFDEIYAALHKMNACDLTMQTFNTAFKVQK